MQSLEYENVSDGNNRRSLLRNNDIISKYVDHFILIVLCNYYYNDKWGVLLYLQ